MSEELTRFRCPIPGGHILNWAREARLRRAVGFAAESVPSGLSVGMPSRRYACQRERGD